MHPAEGIDYLKKMLNEGKGLEPIFIIRGQDIVSGQAVIAWVAAATRAGAPVHKTIRAEEIGEEMNKWPVKKVPD